MGPQVALQQPRAGESFPTELALVVEVVGEDVHGQGRHADVHLVTDVALFSIVRVQAPVCLPVPGEVAAGGVVLATVSAGVLRLLTLLTSLLAPPVGDGQPVPRLLHLPVDLSADLSAGLSADLPGLLVEAGLGRELPRV